MILYTLLVGKLPFEDDNLGNLYRKIQSGVFHMPLWLSKDARSMISCMLQVNPRNRITVQQLLKHPWINAYKASDFIEIQKGQIDEELLWQVHKYFQTTQYGELKRNILEKFGYQTATYWLLKEKQKNGISPIRYRPERFQCQLTNTTDKTDNKSATPTGGMFLLDILSKLLFYGLCVLIYENYFFSFFTSSRPCSWHQA